MELFKYLFGVVLVCYVSAQNYWLQGLQKYQPSLEHVHQQGKVPSAPVDECDVEEAEKILCGTPDVTAEQCEVINCCFNGRQCYYRKAGNWFSCFEVLFCSLSF